MRVKQVMQNQNLRIEQRMEDADVPSILRPGASVASPALQTAEALDRLANDARFVVALLDPCRPALEGLSYLLGLAAYPIILAERRPGHFLDALHHFTPRNPGQIVIIVMEIDLVGLSPSGIDVIQTLATFPFETRTIAYTYVRSDAILAEAKAAGAYVTLRRHEETPTIENTVTFVSYGARYYTHEQHPEQPANPPAVETLRCPLAAAELEQVALCAMGFSYAAIAAITRCTLHTIRSRAKDIHAKLGQHRVGAAWHHCHQQGWLTKALIRSVAHQRDIDHQTIPTDYLSAFDGSDILL